MRAILALAVAAAACRPAGTSTITVGQRERHYELFAPSDAAGLPLVIALHGTGSTGRQMERYTKLDEVAAREGFVAVYPDAIDHHWNDGRPELDSGVDDVAFIASLIDELAAEQQIDPHRVFVTGISNGGMMSYHLACTLADRIRAIAPVAGDLPVGPCAPAAPVSVLAINGTGDPLVPYDGGQVGRGRGHVLSAPASVGFFAERAGCAAPGPTLLELDADPNDGARPRHMVFEGCPAPLGAELVTIEGGGHTWPGASQYLPAVVIGPTDRDFDASERIWTFFVEHSTH